MHNVQVEVSKWQHSSAEWLTLAVVWAVTHEWVWDSKQAAVTTRSSVACTSLVLPLNYSARRVLTEVSGATRQFPIKPLHLFWMLLEHWTKNEGITHEHGEFRKSSLAGPISGLMSYDGRVLRLAYEVGKTDGNYRSMASLASCSAKERLGCHAGYDGWRTRCHFCDL